MIHDNIITITRGRVFALALLALALAVACSCDGWHPVDVVVTDYEYDVTATDARPGDDVPAECVIRLVKGGEREEAVTLNYKVDDNLSLRVSIGGTDVLPGAQVSFDLQGLLRLRLPDLGEGSHVLHLLVTNRYGKAFSADVPFRVVGTPVPVVD